MAEITSLGISPSASAAVAVYTSGQISQSWVDVFDLNTQHSYTKTVGVGAFFGPRGSRLATVRYWTVQLAGGVEYHHSSSVLLRDFGTGKTFGELKEVRGEPVAWSRDGKMIAAGDVKHRVSVEHVNTGTRAGNVVSHTDTVTHAAFTPDNMLVTASKDGTLRISNPATSRTISKLEIENSTNPRALAVSPDGKTIISIWGTSVHIWVPQADYLTSYALSSVRKSEGWPLCISPDCRWLVCRTEDGFDMMNVSSGDVVYEQKTDVLVTAAAVSADGKVFLLGKMDGSVEAWDVEEKRA